jgi:hypothetical protein
MFQTKVVEEIKTHVLCSIKFSLSLKFFRLRDIVETYCRAGKATDDSMALAHCMLDNQGHTNKQTQYLLLLHI